MTGMFKLRSSIRKFAAYGLILVLILGIGFTDMTAYADNAAEDQDVAFSDVEDHWAAEQILDWSGRGLVAGYANGTFGPERGVTRAEFITFVNRAYGLKEKASAAFVDVSSADWFVDEVAKAVAAEYISGYDDGTMRPNAEISRLEAAVILYRLLRLDSYKSESWIDGFNDADTIADWGRVYVNSAVAEGYFSGYPDGTFKPGRVITRAETVSLLSKAAGTLYNVSGVYGPAEHNKRVEGNVTVSVSGVTLKDLTIEGDLFLTAGIGDGDFEADGVVVKGRTIIGGGGYESIVFNNSTLGDVIVYVVDGKVRVVAKGDTSINDVILESGGFLQEENLTGEGFGNVQILVLKPGQEVELDGEFDSVDKEASVEMSVTGNTRIKELNVSEHSYVTEINLGRDTVIDTLTLDGGTDIMGKGTIKTANVNTDDYSFEKDPDKTVIEGEKPKKEEEEKGKRKPSPSKRAVTGINVKPAKMYLELDKTATITATVLPSNASNKSVTWSSDDDEVATVVDGVVTPVKIGKAIITVTTVDGEFTATCVVTVIPTISEDADIAAGDFSVMTISDVIGYNVGLVLSSGVTASDVAEIVVTLYDKEGIVLAANTSAGILEKYNDATNLSAPFDVYGNFDYERDGCWDYSGWLGENSDVPAKAKIVVAFKNGVEKTAANENLTGDISIFTKNILNKTQKIAFDTIQDAIAVALEGDTILVAPGVYEGNLKIDVKNLILKSTKSRAAVVKVQTAPNAGSGYGGITVLADGVIIEGFTIQHDGEQSVIHTHNSDNVTIIDNHISGNQNPRGIDVGYASADSNNVEIKDNEFVDIHCGVYVNQGNALVINGNRFETMVEGAIVFDGSWGNTDGIVVENNYALDATYLLYFHNAVGTVSETNNTLVDTELTNYEYYNPKQVEYYPSIQAGINWSVAVENHDTKTNQMRTVAVAEEIDNNAVYIGYIQTHTPPSRDVHRYDLEYPYDLLSVRGKSAAQPKGLAVDDRGYVYVANREGGGSYASEISVYNSDFSELVATLGGGNDNFGGIAIYCDGENYYMYIAREGYGHVHRYDITDLESVSLDNTFGTNGLFTVAGGGKLRGITVDLDGTIFVADRDNGKLFRIDPDLETTSVSVPRAMDVALFDGNAYVTSYNNKNSLIRVVDKVTLKPQEDLKITTINNGDYTRGANEGWSGIDISLDGRIWLCDQDCRPECRDRLLVSSPIPLGLNK